MKKLLTALFLAAWLIAACTPSSSAGPDSPVSSDDPASAPGAPSYDPQPGDDQLTRSNAYVESVEVRLMESFPVQVGLGLKGNLPTPCEQLRIQTAAPDAENQIVLDVYSVAEAGQMCAEVLQPFEANLNLGSFPSGHYTLWINGEMRGEFDT